MTDKKVARQRRAKRTRMKIRELGALRLCVHRTPRHIYAQVTTAEGDKVLASASTVEKELRASATSNAEAAVAVGKLIAERAKALALSALPLIAPASSSMAGSRRWPMPRVKTGLNSKGTGYGES